ncbi:MAG: hypothetical protein IKI49_05865, partial [Oscillospiraceae bacterium]|nr:hypothetical protein [Oscillospiraceae bacterium]
MDYYGEKRDGAASRQLRLMRLQTVLIACILVAVLFAVIFIAVQFRAIGRCVDTIEQSLKIMDTDALNDAVSAFNDAAE